MCCDTVFKLIHSIELSSESCLRRLYFWLKKSATLSFQVTSVTLLHLLLINSLLYGISDKTGNCNIIFSPKPHHCHRLPYSFQKRDTGI